MSHKITFTEWHTTHFLEKLQMQLSLEDYSIEIVLCSLARCTGIFFKRMELGFMNYLPTYVEFPTKAKVNINGFSP